MIKKVIGLIVISITGGALLYLDCLNKQEKNSSEQIRLGIEQVRAQGKQRGQAKELLASQQLDSFKQCQLGAEKAREAYGAVIQQLAPRKRGQMLIPQAVRDESEIIYSTAQSECKRNYDTHTSK